MKYFIKKQMPLLQKENVKLRLYRRFISMIKRKLALLGTAVAVSLLMTVPAFAADTKDTDTAQNAQNTQSVQEEKAEENTGYVTCSVLNVRRASSE